MDVQALQVVFDCMSSLQTSPAIKLSKRKGDSHPRAIRSLSASEIARNLKHFETWSTHQCCEQISYSDLPEDAKADAQEVFDVTGRLPIAWIDKLEFRRV